MHSESTLLSSMVSSRLVAEERCGRHGSADNARSQHRQLEGSRHLFATWLRQSAAPRDQVFVEISQGPALHMLLLWLPSGRVMDSRRCGSQHGHVCRSQRRAGGSVARFLSRSRTQHLPRLHGSDRTRGRTTPRCSSAHAWLVVSCCLEVLAVSAHKM